VTALAITDDHVELERVVRRFVESRGVAREAREALDSSTPSLPSWWAEVADLGWLGLHVPEQYGGSGYSCAEASIVIAEFGRAASPGPLFTTILAAAVILATGSESQKKTLLPSLCDGTIRATVAPVTDLHWDGDGRVDGVALAAAAEVCELLLVAVDGDLAVLHREDLAGVSVCATKSVDLTRRTARIVCRKTMPPVHDILLGGESSARNLAWAFASAEAAGGAIACTEAASKYAAEREQFGRPIGTFQAVKHHCANMFCQSELAVAAAWEAARSIGSRSEDYACASAMGVAVAAYASCARTNVQVHGGIGFTWEHDAHLHLRRALSLEALFGSINDAHSAALRVALGGQRDRISLDLRSSSEEVRQQARSAAARIRTLPEADRRTELLDAGYLLPHWPAPWGVDAPPADQLVIDEELAEFDRRVPGEWMVLTLWESATPEQQTRWIRSILDGTRGLCQLFSEPDAGSDLASLRTRAERVDGGWRLNGQKVWTSAATGAHYGFALVRTDSVLPRHQGITAMLITMNAPGVEVRPLREMTGDALFSEVFLSDVFVPDADVIGPVNGGWRVARSMMANERVVIGSSITHIALDDLLDLAATHVADAADAADLASIVCEHHALTALDTRRALRSIHGGQGGAEGNVTKLLSNELDQRMADLAIRLLGSSAAAGDTDGAKWTYQFLFTRCYTIAGGTSEIARNAIGEQLLGLPRDR
jgi:alkylation response protein AidB-like acyl-CoA dehydrogenase